MQSPMMILRNAIDCIGVYDADVAYGTSVITYLCDITYLCTVLGNICSNDMQGLDDYYEAFIAEYSRVFTLVKAQYDNR